MKIPFAMMFPGQGSQKIGITNNISQNYYLIKKIFDQASNAIGYDLWNIMKYGKTKNLHNTIHTQLILLTSSVALFYLWKEQGGENPSILVGHSLGEYSALVCADSLSLKDAVCLVKIRGQLMKKAMLNKPEGGMIIVRGLNNDRILKICQSSSQEDSSIVEPVILNCPKEIVIAGNKTALLRVEKNCKMSGAGVVSLPIDIPCHCKLMKPVAKEFTDLLNKVHLRPPRLPVLNNVYVKCENNPSKIRTALVRQLYMPFDWIKCIKFIIHKGIVIFIEVGAGHVLSRITKNISSSLTTISVENSDLFKQKL
ncbi:MAG: ACP S-malonyltransferase [Candidatus Dasytiphilus stammeri]